MNIIRFVPSIGHMPLSILAGLVFCLAVSCSSDPGEDGSADALGDTTVEDGSNEDSMMDTAADSGGDGVADSENDTSVSDMGSDTSTMASAIGGPCTDSSDCADADAICMAESGSQWGGSFPGGYCTLGGCEGGSCPAGSSCFRFTDDATWCLPTCGQSADCRGGYVCDEFDTCWPGESCTPGSCGSGQVCSEDGVCVEAPCTPGSCASGQVCDQGNGRCVIDLGQVPQGSPPSSCPQAPSWSCDGDAAWCSEVVYFEPETGPGWWNYPLNGETQSNQYRSYLRRDTIQMIKYATAMVDCVAGDWSGNGGVLGLGDMSEANGAIPGTSVGQPGHPEGTHLDGLDIDIAYYQVGTEDNRLRPVCDHTEAGQDVYHCVSDPYALDVWRTALFLAYLHDAVVNNYLQLRVVGVDGTVGPLLDSAMDQLCAAGWYEGNACNPQLRTVTWEETNQERGWYYFHHHHLHASTNGLTSENSPFLTADDCLTTRCDQLAPTRDPRRLIYRDQWPAPRMLLDLQHAHPAH